jgi:hypothetical protein
MQNLEFCEGCLNLFNSSDLIDTDLVPTDFHGLRSDKSNGRDVVICQECFDMAVRNQWSELINLKKYFGAIGIGIAPSGKTISFNHSSWYLAVYCNR